MAHLSDIACEVIDQLEKLNVADNHPLRLMYESGHSYDRIQLTLSVETKHAQKVYVLGKNKWKGHKWKVSYKIADEDLVHQLFQDICVELGKETLRFTIDALTAPGKNEWRQICLMKFDPERVRELMRMIRTPAIDSEWSLNYH